MCEISAQTKNSAPVTDDMDQGILRFLQEQTADHEDHAHEQRLGGALFF